MLGIVKAVVPWPPLPTALNVCLVVTAIDYQC